MRDEGRLKGVITGIRAGLLFVGTIIGAGFASGKELLTFFTGTDIIIIISVILAGVFFYLTGLVFMNLGRRIASDSLFKITQKLFKKKGNVFNFFIIFSYLILVAAMLAGIDALARESISYDGFPIFSVILLLAALFVIKFGLKGLLNITTVLVPLELIFLTIICILTLSGNVNWNFNFTSVSGYNVALSAFNCLLYVAFNMLLSAAVLTSAGKNMDNKQINIACLVAAIIISVTMAIILFACRTYSPQIQGMEMPILFLAEKFSVNTANIATIIIASAIFVTLISSLYPLKEYMSHLISSENVCDISIGVTAFILSRVGFSYIIKYIYPLQGVIGIVLIALCLNYIISARKNDKLVNLKPKLPTITFKKNDIETE